MTVYAITNPANIAEGGDRPFVRRSSACGKYGITAEELDAAKQGYLEEQKVSRADDGRLASILGSTSQIGRTMQYYSNLQQQIGDLTVEEVNIALRKYIDPKRIVLAVAGDFAAAASGEE